MRRVVAAEIESIVAICGILSISNSNRNKRNHRLPPWDRRPLRLELRPGELVVVVEDEVSSRLFHSLSCHIKWVWLPWDGFWKTVKRLPLGDS